MANVYWGITCIICFIILYFYAWKNIKLGNEQYAIILLLLGGLVLRTYTAFDFYLHAWDERYHALVAKHLADNWLHPTLYKDTILPSDYKNWTLSHTWLHKQPMALWLMALSIKLFGLHSFVVRIPSIIMSTIGIKLMYDIGKYFFDTKTAFISAYLFATHGFIIDLCAGRCTTDHVDIAFLFFILLAIWFAVKSAQKPTVMLTLLVGVCTGLAVLSKWLPALIVVPIWATLFYGHQRNVPKLLKHMLLLLFTITAVALPWQLFIFHRYPVEAAYEFAFNARHYSEVIEDHRGKLLYYFKYLLLNYGYLAFIPVAVFTCGTLKKRNYRRWAILIWFWVPYLFFSFCATKMENYTVFSAPAVFFMIAATYTFLMDNNTVGKTAGRLIAYSLVLLPVIPFVQRAHPFTKMERTARWSKEIYIVDHSRFNTSKSIVYNCEHSIEIMFYTNCIAYYRASSDSEIRYLQKAGYQVLDIKANPGAQ